MVPMLDLGIMPPANAFISEEELNTKETAFPLRVAVCSRCFALQLLDTVDPDILFSKDYYYFTGASIPLVKHFENYAKYLVKDFSLTKDDLVVEMGSNDGVLLSFLSPFSKVLGVDPAINMGKEAKKRGVPTLEAFFGYKSASQILENEGSATLILANNVFAHVAEIKDVLNGVAKLLAPKGRFVAEVHWAGNLLGKGGFDQIYHEHIYYFSVLALKYLIEEVQGLYLSKVELIPIHGESLRFYVSKEKNIDPSVEMMLEKEKTMGLDRLDFYSAFGSRLTQLKTKLLDTLKTIKKQGKTIVGYGAPAKGNTLLNYFEIGQEILDYITDTTPSKQGSYTPGTHIPIVHPDTLHIKNPDYILLLSWNYADAILEKEKELRHKGVKFIIPVPEIRVV